VQQDRIDEVLVVVYQDPIYEIVVAHYYSCSTALASEIVMVGQNCQGCQGCQDCQDCEALGSLLSHLITRCQAILGEETAGVNESTADAFVADETDDVAAGAVFEKLQLNRKRLKPVRGLGAGQFGMVYLSTFDNSGEKGHVAVKMCRADNKHEDEVRDGAWSVKIGGDGT